MHDARKDLLAGGTFMGFGLAFAITASTYEVGIPLRMGPGYFPPRTGQRAGPARDPHRRQGIRRRRSERIGPIPWKALALLVAALLFFGFTVQGLGLVPALLVTVFLSAMAGHRAGVIPAAVIAVCLTALSVLIFVVALQLRLP